MSAQEPEIPATPLTLPGASAPPVLPNDPYLARRARAIEAKWNVAVDVQMVAVPMELALLFLADLRSGDEQKVEAAVGQIQDLLKKKQALLIAWPSVVTVDGLRSTMESSVEKRYPSVFEPPTIPQASPAGPPPPKSIALVPNSFETRVTGATLEIEPTVLEEGHQIFLSLVANRVALLGFDNFQSGVTPDGIEVKAEQPCFLSHKVNTELKIANGRHVLIAVHPLSDPENHLELFIVRANATKIE